MPLCCCQSASLLGASCQDSEEIAAAHEDVQSCCAGSRALQKALDGASESTHSVNSCKCCGLAKRAAGSGLDAAAKDLRFEQTEVSIPVAILSTSAGESVCGASLFESLEYRDYSAPPLIHANRVLLRWQCALIV